MKVISKAVRLQKIRDVASTLEKAAADLKDAAFYITLESVPRTDFAEGCDFYEEVRQFEVYLIESALLATDNNQAKAARLLGLNTTTLHDKIKRYQLK